LEFDAGHRVPLHESKCKTPHGHRYKVDITCEANELTKEGFVVDFGLIKQYVGTWIDEHWDHTFIIQGSDGFMRNFSKEAVKEGLRPFFIMEEAPTAENLAEHLFNVATALLTHDDEGDPTDYGLRVVSVVVWETPNCGAEYRPLDLDAAALNVI
jgi:6-pyruvoyltetrahydropterin/6-carboxytetrahydropterin synthase